jgi:Chitin binding Peritrophin-A domain
MYPDSFRMLFLTIFLLAMIASSRADLCDGVSNGVFIPSANGDSAAYYICNQGQGVPMLCPGGYYFDSMHQVCKYKEFAGFEAATEITSSVTPSTPPPTTIPTSATTSGQSTIIPTPPPTTLPTSVTTPRPTTLI